MQNDLSYEPSDEHQVREQAFKFHWKQLQYTASEALHEPAQETAAFYFKLYLLHALTDQESGLSALIQELKYGIRIKTILDSTFHTLYLLSRPEIMPKKVASQEK